MIIEKIRIDPHIESPDARRLVRDALAELNTMVQDQGTEAALVGRDELNALAFTARVGAYDHEHAPMGYALVFSVAVMASLLLGFFIGQFFG